MSLASGAPERPWAATAERADGPQRVTQLTALTARDLHRCLLAAADWLGRNRDAVNAINVYPVPDGDTGTNMLLTLRGALDHGAPAEEAPAGPYLREVARRALLAARGNSGVILSQMLRGLSEAAAGRSALDAEALTIALEGASRAADAAVGQPVEGTMLTVLRDAAAAAREQAAAARPGAVTPGSVLATAERAAHASVARTPDLLPVLREAGVVDAGGLGVAVVLTGLACACSGEPLPEPLVAPLGTLDLHAVAHEGHGYCTEFVVAAAQIDRAALEGALAAAGGDSILVVGDAAMVHVHVHTADPGPALSIGAAAGSLHAVKVDNMQAQHEAWLAGHAGARTPDAVPELGLVAVAQGAGLTATLRALGALVVDGGATNNPSVGALLEAAQAAGSRHVFILPNDRNVLAAAEQAASQLPGHVTVIPTRSCAAGLAAAVAYLATGDATAVAEAMTEAAAGVRTVEVTRAVRSATVDGVDVTSGACIALVDGRLTAQRDDIVAVAVEGALAASVEGASLITLIVGGDATAAETTALTAGLQARLPLVEIETIEGGQPHYPYVLGIE